MGFNEHALELSIMELFQNEGYLHMTGNQIHREKSEVLLVDDIRQYLRDCYASDGITEGEIDSIILKISSISGTLYEENKVFLRLLTDGFILTREDRSKKDIFISLVNYEEPEKNIFKIVNQVEIQGYEQLRIPDGIVYVNGLPLVVLEFKTATNENTTILDAYTQLTVRYKRDIPDLFIYNAFVVISDGVNNK